MRRSRHHKSTLALFALLPLLAACETVGGIWHGSLESKGPGAFTYWITTDTTYAEASPTAERLRLQWMETALWMTYGGCPDTFEITERRVEEIGQDRYDPEHRITYRIFCPPDLEEAEAEPAEVKAADPDAPAE